MVNNLSSFLTVENLFHIATLLVIALFARLLVALFLDGMVRKLAANTARPRVKTLSSIVAGILTTVIWLLTLLFLLKEIGFDTTPLLASAGIVGISIAFGAQTLVKDWISGFFLLIEDQFREGEIIEIAGKKGEVEKTAHRTVVIKEKDGQVTTIPYSAITTVTNFSRKKDL